MIMMMMETKNNRKGLVFGFEGGQVKLSTQLTDTLSLSMLYYIVLCCIICCTIWSFTVFYGAVDGAVDGVLLAQKDTLIDNRH